ncbi:hypothetical protein [Streptomyces sp. NPDC005953]|uniref:hypothetical protein n=1 Tax=Streptomyces sp. NPDC005953 TaxID=3156719 RepID=UPI00340D28AF
MSTRHFAEVAVDPATGWSPSKSLVAKIIRGLGYDVTPTLVSAIAVGLELPRDVIAAAAHFQVIGFTESELSGSQVTQVLHQIERPVDTEPKSTWVAERWDSEE